jgi:DNA-directed RNA polymerase subunit alpha
MPNSFLQSHPTIKSNIIKNSEVNYSLIIEPLSPGYGYTLGNSLRRIFLSSIPGYGITKVKINDLTHEYQPVEGIVEDAMQIVLNLKALRPQITNGDEKVILSLFKSGEGVVKASDFKSNINAKIGNPDAYICTMNKGAKLEIEIEISKGVGYLSMDDVNLSDNKDARQILVDALFSPVTNVSLDVSKVRVGDKTNFDKLEISFDIDNTITPKEVVDYAFEIMIEMFNNAKNVLQIGNETPKTTKIATPKTVEVVSPQDKIDLPDKITKILTKNGISTKADLKARIGEVADFTGIGAKAMEEVQAYIDNL